MKTDSTSGSRRLHGWYSQLAIDHGAATYIYRRANGEEVELHCVTNSPVRSVSASAVSPDAVYMGEFVEFVKQGKQKRGLRPFDMVTR